MARDHNLAPDRAAAGSDRRGGRQAHSAPPPLTFDDLVTAMQYKVAAAPRQQVCGFESKPSHIRPQHVLTEGRQVEGGFCAVPRSERCPKVFEATWLRKCAVVWLLQCPQGGKRVRRGESGRVLLRKAN